MFHVTGHDGRVWQVEIALTKEIRAELTRAIQVAANHAVEIGWVIKAEVETESEGDHHGW